MTYQWRECKRVLRKEIKSNKGGVIGEENKN
jgi:hypothetical protein